MFIPQISAGQWKHPLWTRLLAARWQGSGSGQEGLLLGAPAQWQILDRILYGRSSWLPCGHAWVPMGSPQTLSINFQASNEFIQNAETLSGEQPLLPRSLEVPEMERQMEPGSGKGTGSEMGTAQKPNKCWGNYHEWIFCTAFVVGIICYKCV